jgi:hypothetical protein
MSTQEHPEEIEVTLAMVEAGTLTFWDGDTRFEDMGDVLTRVYRAMAAAKLMACPESAPQVGPE